MATAKIVNYTPEQTAAILAGYDPKASETERKAMVEALAKTFGKTARSIVAKLSREKVYVAKSYETKAGEKPIKKDATADAIGKVLGLSDGETDSLAKANKTALAKLLKALVNSIPANVETPDETQTKAENLAAMAEYYGLDSDDVNSLMRAGSFVIAKLTASVA